MICMHGIHSIALTPECGWVACVSLGWAEEDNKEKAVRVPGFPSIWSSDSGRLKGILPAALGGASTATLPVQVSCTWLPQDCMEACSLCHASLTTHGKSEAVSGARRVGSRLWGVDIRHVDACPMWAFQAGTFAYNVAVTLLSLWCLKHAVQLAVL